jgi:HAD superfamily phosphatase
MSDFSAAVAIAVFDIDGVLRDVSGSYRRALADTVEHFTDGQYRPGHEAIDTLKGEGLWNNDWEASQELVYRYFEGKGQSRASLALNYDTLVDFFQSRYRGPNQADPDQWSGYITQEPLLTDLAYFEALTRGGIAWGFFSGATRGSASYILERRLGITPPALIAMEDAPGKPDPSGLLTVVDTLTQRYHLPPALPVLYAGDTVADVQTLVRARAHHPQRPWFGVGILPPQVAHGEVPYRQTYSNALRVAGADAVVDGVGVLTADSMLSLVNATNAP